MHLAHFAQHLPSHLSPWHLSQHFLSLLHFILSVHFIFFLSSLFMFFLTFTTFSTFFCTSVSCAKIVCDTITARISVRTNTSFFIKHSLLFNKLLENELKFCGKCCFPVKFHLLPLAIKIEENRSNSKVIKGCILLYFFVDFLETSLLCFPGARSFRNPNISLRQYTLKK